MPMTDGFRNLIAIMAVGESFTAFNNANAYIGVGDSANAFSSAQTDLQGTNKLRHPMKAGFPTRSNNSLYYGSRFEEHEANFHWREGAIFNAEIGGVMMCRFLDDNGVKPSDEIWDYEVTANIIHG